MTDPSPRALLLCVACLAPLSIAQDERPKPSDVPETQEPNEGSDSPKIQEQDQKSDSEGKQKRSRKAQLAEKRKALAKADRELTYTGLEVKIAELKTMEDLDKARLDQGSAEQALASAEGALVLAKVEEQLADSEAELATRRAEHRLESAIQDLEGILRIYAEETEARAKPEIIRRHQQSVAFAREELALSQQRKARTLGHTLPLKRADLEWKRTKAAADLARAKAAVSRMELAGILERTRKEDAATDAERKAKKLTREIAKLEEEPLEREGGQG